MAESEERVSEKKRLDWKLGLAVGVGIGAVIGAGVTVALYGNTINNLQSKVGDLEKGLKSINKTVNKYTKKVDNLYIKIQDVYKALQNITKSLENLANYINKSTTELRKDLDNLTRMYEEIRKHVGPIVKALTGEELVFVGYVQQMEDLGTKYRLILNNGTSTYAVDEDKKEFRKLYDQLKEQNPNIRGLVGDPTVLVAVTKSGKVCIIHYWFYDKFGNVSDPYKGTPRVDTASGYPCKKWLWQYLTELPREVRSAISYIWSKVWKRN